jgi:cytochrome P450
MLRYDPYSLSTQENPYSIYKVLRDEYPVYFVEKRNVWLMTRYRDCMAAVQDHAAWSSAQGNVLDDDQRRTGNTLGTTDPPRHEELRRLVTKGFTPARVAQLEDMIRSMSRDLINTFISEGQCEFTSQFAGALTAGVTGHLLGVPSGDHAQLRDWVDKVVEHTDGDAPPADRSEYVGKLFLYVLDLVQQRRAKPQDDLISDLISAEDAGARLTDQEIAIICPTLLIAAFASTNLTLGNALVALYQHPEQRAEVHANPKLISNMLEEVVRWDSAIQGVARHSTRNVEIEDIVIPKGAQTVLVFGSANRDERQFPDPDRFDIHRKVGRHLGFGWGIHVCLGAPLARLEMRVAFEELLPRLGNYEVDLAHAHHVHSPIVRGYQVLPVSFSPA